MHGVGRLQLSSRVTLLGLVVGVLVAFAPAARADGLGVSPDVSLSGPAWDTPQQAATTGTLPLTVSATDPRSGVVSITTKVNGAPYPEGPNAQQSCPTGGCALSAAGAINLADLHAGDNNVEVDATDASGNVSPVEWAISLPGENADIQAMAAQSLESEYSLRSSQAYADLQYQDTASQWLDSIDAAIGSAASGDDWFDPKTGRLNIGVVSNGPPSGPNVDAATKILSDHGLLDGADFVPVTHSLQALEAAQSTIDDQLSALEQLGEVMTSIDPTRNAIVIDEVAGIRALDASAVQQAASTSGVKTMVLDAGVSSLFTNSEACGFNDIGSPTPNWVTCDPSLRGGVAINATAFNCTAGFNARVLRGSGFSPVVMTAGHCIRNVLSGVLPGFDLPAWRSYDAAGRPHDIGGGGPPRRNAQPYTAGPGGDYGYFTNDHNGYWKARQNIYAGAASRQYSIRADGTSHVGMEICMTSAIPLSSSRTGPGIPDPVANHHSTCGHVWRLNVTACEQFNLGGTICVRHEGMTTIGVTVRGSSGGPYFMNHTAYGIHNARAALNDALVKCTPISFCNNSFSIYNGIRAAEKGLGVSVLGL